MKSILRQLQTPMELQIREKIEEQGRALCGDYTWVFMDITVQEQLGDQIAGQVGHVYHQLYDQLDEEV